ncbi:uncharacterized protein [Amphiura filiformis]|uniref:uncharacterized protein n=1 Tax=Amphiura filiformis TaxID=82378 RepID=UPI003B216BCE
MVITGNLTSKGKTGGKICCYNKECTTIVTMASLKLLFFVFIIVHIKGIAGQDFVAYTNQNEDSIYYSNVTCSLEFQLEIIYDSDSGPRGIDYDPMEQKLYWVDSTNKRISRSDVDGSNVETVISNTRQPYALALDTTNRIVYWTQLTNTNDGIRYINMDGTGQGDVPGSDSSASSSGTDARALAVGAISGDIYIAFSSDPQIRRHSKDGMTAETLIAVNDDIQDPRGLYVDEANSRLYWSDEILNKIEVYDWSGMSATRTVLFQGLSTNIPRGLDAYKGDLYFIDAVNTEEHIYRIPLDGSSSTPIPIPYTIDTGSLKHLIDLVMYDSGTLECLEVSFDTSLVEPVCEGDDVTFTVTNHGTKYAVFDVTTLDGVAIGGEDFQVKNEAFNLTAGESVNVAIQILDDSIYESSETFTVHLMDENGELIPYSNGSVTVTIEPDLRCKEVEYQSDDFILSANAGRDNIYTAPLTCFKVFRFTSLPIDSIDKPRGLSYDPVERKIYWIEAANTKIVRSNYDGTDPEDVVTGISSPYALRLDIVNRIVFWTQLIPAKKGIRYIYMDKTRQGFVSNSDFGATDATALAVGNITELIYIAYTGATPQIRRFSLDGSVDETLIAANDDIDTVGGMYLDENAGKLYWSDRALHKIEIYDLQSGSRSSLFSGTAINDPGGLSAYKEYMYFIDGMNFPDGYDISRIALDGSETESTQMWSVFDEWGVNSATDILMYDFGKPQEIVCGPEIYFEEVEIGPICEGKSVSVTLHNIGDRDGTVNVTTVLILNETLISAGVYETEVLDFTAFGDEDFENKTIEVSIPVNGSVTVGCFNVIADDVEELEEELFGLQLQSTGWDVDLTFNRTANVTIAADNDTLCEILPCISGIRLNQRYSTNTNSYLLTWSEPRFTRGDTWCEADEVQVHVESTVMGSSHNYTRPWQIENSIELVLNDGVENYIVEVTPRNTPANQTSVKGERYFIKAIPVYPVIDDAYAGGMTFSISIDVDVTLTDWTIELNFRRQVFQLKIVHCIADVLLHNDKTRKQSLWGGHRSTYVITTGPGYQTLNSGDTLDIQMTANVWKKLRPEGDYVTGMMTQVYTLSGSG